MNTDKIKQVAQWVIDNRYAKSEYNKVSDFEMYNEIINRLQSLEQIPFDADAVVFPIQSDNIIEVLPGNRLSKIAYINNSEYSETQPTSQELKKLKEVYKSLGFENTTVISIAYDIIEACKQADKNNFVISTSGGNLLIYRNVNGQYNNLIIDEDGDIAYMCIPRDRKNSFNQLYPFATFDANTLAEKL